MTTIRRIISILLLTLLAVLVGASPSSAEDGYRYWNYSHLDGETFAFAETGPADFVPEDGAVEGWRFGTSTVSDGIEPRADLDDVSFDTVCGDSTAADGEKRVAVLVDYGTEADADGAEVPAANGACAVVPEDANGLQVLESVVDVRTDQAMICALDGYPASGCGSPVGDADVQADEAAVDFALPSSSADSDDEGISWPLIGVGALVVVLAAIAVPLYRRNRES